MGDLTSYDDFTLTKQQMTSLKPTLIPLSKKRSPKPNRKNQSLYFHPNSQRRHSNSNDLVPLRNNYKNNFVILEENNWHPIHSPGHMTDEELDNEFWSWKRNGEIGPDKASEYLFYQ